MELVWLPAPAKPSSPPLPALMAAGLVLSRFPSSPPLAAQGELALHGRDLSA